VNHPAPATPELLARFALFDQAEPSTLAAFASIATRRSLDAKSVVVRQGETDDSLYCVLEGLLQVGVQASDGREIVLGLMNEGQMFGDLALFDQAGRSATVSTLKRSELLVFPAGSLLPALRAHPEISLRMLRRMAGLVRRLTTRVEELSALPIHTRLARKLLEIGEICGTPLGPNQLALPSALSQQHLANHIQATRESVNKALATWTKYGLLQRSSTQLVIQDRRGLVALAGRGEDKQPDL
jgi:CRP/FNR family transcriptional regulator, cyclic AMP receptor protein